MPRRSSDIFLDVLDESVSSIIKRAIAEVDKSNCEEALELLEPLIHRKNAAALFYASGFSSAPKETIEDYEIRRIQQLQQSAQYGYAPAIHELAVHYDSGDLVAKDTEKAAQLFKQAAEKGHPHSQWIYGLDLLYGRNGIQKDEKIGIDYVKKSAHSKFEGALESISNFYETGKYGFPIDSRKANYFKDQINDQDVISY